MNVMKTISDFVRAYDAEVKAALVRAEKADTALARATSDEPVTRVLAALGIEVPMGSFPGQKQEGWVGAMQPWADAAKSVAKALKGEVK